MTIHVFSEEQLRRAMRSDAGLNHEFDTNGRIEVKRTVVAEPSRVEDQSEWKAFMKSLRIWNNWEGV